MAEQSPVYGLAREKLENWTKEIGLIADGMRVILDDVEDKTGLRKTTRAMLGILSRSAEEMHEEMKDVINRL